MRAALPRDVGRAAAAEGPEVEAASRDDGSSGRGGRGPSAQAAGAAARDAGRHAVGAAVGQLSILPQRQHQEAIREGRRVPHADR